MFWSKSRFSKKDLFLRLLYSLQIRAWQNLTEKVDWIKCSMPGSTQPHELKPQSGEHSRIAFRSICPEMNSVKNYSQKMNSTYSFCLSERFFKFRDSWSPFTARSQRLTFVHENKCFWRSKTIEYHSILTNNVTKSFFQGDIFSGTFQTCKHRTLPTSI